MLTTLIVSGLVGLITLCIGYHYGHKYAAYTFIKALMIMDSDNGKLMDKFWAALDTMAEKE